MKNWTDKIPPIWKQAMANSLTIMATAIGILGGYQSIKSCDRDYESQLAFQKSQSETLLAMSKDSANKYEARVEVIRKKIVEVESKIDALKIEGFQKDPKSGVLITGENIELSKQIMADLEDLNKEVFRLPPELGIPVNVARTELFNRFQQKSFQRHFPNHSGSASQPNPYFVREFETTTNSQLRQMVNKSK